MARLCVFCGSSEGARPAYREAAERLGRTLASRGHGIVYGGASVGLMGALADAALAAGGEVIGVIPQSLVEREIAHSRLSALHVVATMHERKATMASLADAFLALPGGNGTLDELFEALTWQQLGIHGKPIGAWDVEGYFAPLVRAMDHAVAEGFLRPRDRARLILGAELDPLLTALLG